MTDFHELIFSKLKYCPSFNSYPISSIFYDFFDTYFPYLYHCYIPGEDDYILFRLFKRYLKDHHVEKVSS